MLCMLLHIWQDHNPPSSLPIQSRTRRLGLLQRAKKVFLFLYWLWIYGFNLMLSEAKCWNFCGRCSFFCWVWLFTDRNRSFLSLIILGFYHPMASLCFGKLIWYMCLGLGPSGKIKMGSVCSFSLLLLYGFQLFREATSYNFSKTKSFPNRNVLRMCVRLWFFVIWKSCFLSMVMVNDFECLNRAQIFQVNQYILSTLCLVFYRKSNGIVEFVIYWNVIMLLLGCD